MKCEWDDCDREAVARGYCYRCYQRARRTGLQKKTAVEWFLQTIEPDGECVRWTGYIHPETGYGMTGGNMAHRRSYQLFVGPIPQGLVIDHLCRNRWCVNPAHLEPVTHRVNLLRGDTQTRRHAEQTHCVHGHPFDAANTYRWRGSRVCRTCRRLREAARRAARSRPAVT